MFVVTVTFTIRTGQVDLFIPPLRENAEISMRDEEGCHQFDICTDRARPRQVFLYEVYSDEAAFDAHMKSEHYKAFQTATVTMISSKEVRSYATVYQ